MFFVTLNDTKYTKPTRATKSNHPHELLTSIDVYELFDVEASKLILEIKVKQTKPLPKFINVKCSEETGIEIVNERLVVNKHLSYHNGFKIVRAFFNLKQAKKSREKTAIRDKTKKECVIEVGASKFELKYGLDENEKTAYKAQQKNLINKKLKKLSNDTKRLVKGNDGLNLRVTLLNVNDTLNGTYIWNDNKLTELDSTSRELFEKVNNKSIEDCGGYSKINLTGSILHTQYRKSVLKEMKQGGRLASTKIYVSLTTNPKRLSTVHYVLQTLDMDLINSVFITLPRRYKDTEMYNISRELTKRFSKVKFLSIDRDIGPAAKVLPAAQYVRSVRGGNHNDIIISIDDDNAYVSTMVSTLVYYSLQCGENCAMATSSQLINYWDIASVGFPPQFDSSGSVNSSKFARTELIEGYAAIAYRTRNFDLPLFDSIIFGGRDQKHALSKRREPTLYEACHLSDDMLLSYVLSYSNVTLMGLKWYPELDPETDTSFSQCGFYNVWSREELTFFNDTYAIHAMNFDGSRGSQRNMNRVKYKLCFQHLIRNFLNFDTPSLEFKSRDLLLGQFLKN
jgi:hypothetical protein